jgi:hypothetical protein
MDEGRIDLRFTRNDGITVNVSTNGDFNDILRLESLSSTFLITGNGGETLNDVVDGDGGRVSDTCTRKKGRT